MCKHLRDISYTNWVIVYFVSNFVAMATGVARGGICLTLSTTLPRKTPAMCKNLGDIPAQAELLPILSKILLLWLQGSVVVEFVWRHSIARPWKPPDRRKNLGDISYTSWVVVDFVPNFVAMATWVDRGGIFTTCSIAWLRKPPATCKNLCDVSRTSWVIAYFVSNFVAMASGVGRGRICVTSFNSPTLKTPW